MKDEAFGIVPIFVEKTSESTEIQFLLIRHWAGHWGFPKGHAEPGETAIATACRELAEETGIQSCEVLNDTSFIEQYRFKKDDQLIKKTVTYFLGIVQSKAVTCQEQEIQDYTWVNFDTALTTITFDQARRILQRVQDYLQAHPL
ncbi:MAG: NUDIX domain-containing protein [Timaviella obliquedivisa GSE-PSE-MK23-08B]|nr:NUDIX domain-containing protein [Timaviella obliquedivisa GSE-PSE-MK23-08B]